MVTDQAPATDLTEVEVSRPPDVLRTALRSAAMGVLPGGGADELPRNVQVLRDHAIDPGHLAAYNRVCGFANNGTVPATYLHVLAFPMAIGIMGGRDFPLPLVGQVHVANRITQSRPVGFDESVTLRAHVRDLRPHRRGRQFDAVHEAVIGDEVVVSSVSTYLVRGGENPDAPRPEIPEVTAEPTAQWSLRSDLGRRYGAASGDRNPIHLHPLTAKALGFKRHIAHGMWTLARSLASLEGRIPASFVNEAWFQAPIMLPAKVDVATSVTADETRLQVRSRSGKAHLTTTVSGG